ncbi:class I SAM-dependent methyltransferase [Luteolibacter arcticus]|uniref:Class I SAM-dependent methyltransferase n=1 Tax=Luteolibacter arcticus TaxID=1581411 RepID=A0ABT3GCW4_9BACT|nr:class I SAM-dependent methyltransferase [Luteolibacter arcticus]MCW1921093.1 class I SAM-dependent methyltransferase [Luteolibacter arcticus]
MPERGRFQGMLSVARFNWPFYLIAGILLMAGVTAMFALPKLRLIAALPVAGCLWFLLGSLGVSHWVYDRSDLYRWRWLDRALAKRPAKGIVVCHAGFDEVSHSLSQHLPDVRVQVLDHYDAAMPEPSIHRARRMFPPLPGTIPARFDAWPELSADTIFGLLAIHEFRPEKDRAAWFAEARRGLVPGGSIIIAEHLRDLANFAAFGPGFMHFHSVASWRRSWEKAGLTLADTFRITPFVCIFVLTVA